MIRQGKNWLMAGLLAVAVSACFDDPTADLRGGASALNLDRSTIVFTPDSTIPIIALLQDAQGNMLPIGGITWSSNDPAVASVLPDTVNLTPGLSSARAFITGVAGGGTYIKATAGGHSDSVFVVTLPPAFNGTITAAGTVGSNLTISSTALFTFDPANVAVFVNGVPAFVTAATASQVTFQTGMVTGGVVTIEGLKFLGSITLGALDAATTINVTDATEPGNDASATAIAVTGLTAAGSTAVVYQAVDGGADGLDYFTFTMPVTGTISLELAFPGDGSGADDENPDFDVVVCTTLSATSTCGYAQDIIPGNGASSVSQPEVGTTSSVTAGTVVYVRTYGYFATGDAPQTPYRLTLSIN